MKLSKTSSSLLQETFAIEAENLDSLSTEAQALLLDRALVKVSEQLNFFTASEDSNSTLVNFLNSADPEELSKYLADYRRSIKTNGHLFEQTNKVLNRKTLFLLKPEVRKAVCSILLLLSNEANIPYDSIWIKIVASGGQMFRSDL
jgi:hypothetical protein